jgi:Spy/CpxP family protein refolding chaperone
MTSRVVLIALLCTGLLPVGASAQGYPAHHHGAGMGAMPHATAPDAPPASPYAGQQGRELKALGPEDVTALQQGTGMGLAKAAELNHYPGPAHVLQLAAELDLDARQRAATEAVMQAMQARARQLGAEILHEERALDAAFADGRIDEATLADLTARIAALQGQLRATHLRAHLEMRALLTPAQVGAYDRLRGYAGP